jgi:hypothetical protein
VRKIRLKFQGVNPAARWHEKLELTRGNVVSLKISGNLRQIVYVA